MGLSIAMSAPVIVFETTIAARREDGGVAISLLDGTFDEEKPGEAACVAILLCTMESARALVATLGSIVQPHDGQPDSNGG